MGAGASTKALDGLDAALKTSIDSGKLVITHRELPALPPEMLARATHLRELILEHTTLRQLPASFGCLVLLDGDVIRRLSLAGNELETLPMSFSELKRLEELDVSDNKLRSLLGNFCDLSALRRLYAQSNALKRLPREFGALSSLEMLDLRNNALRKLPKSFPCLTSLTRLDLSSNKLKQLPEAFGNLSGLRMCVLGRNLLQELPEFIGMLVGLQVLSLSNNALYKLPASFSELSSLTNLSLTGNRIECFPGPQLGGLKALVTLSYTQNRLRQWQPGERVNILDEDATDTEDKADDLTDDATNEGEEAGGDNVLQNPFVNLSAVQYLDFSDNALVHLPARGWDQLSELLHLKLARNRLESLPNGLKELPKLQRLDIAGNKLKTLPPALFAVKTLEILDVQKNSLHELPENMGECEALTRLTLTKNQNLHGLPASLRKLSRLQELRVDKACFLALDEEQTTFCRSVQYFSAE